MMFMSKPDLTGKIPLDDVLLKVKKSNQAFRENLEKEEANERVETIDSIQNQILADKKNSERKKKQFIDEIKNGLGEKILTTNGVKIKKKTLGWRIKRFFTRLYARF
jgi:hypothetical protein